MQASIIKKGLLLLLIPVTTHAQWVNSGTTVNNNGNVGVNAPTPLYPLHVKAHNNSGSAGAYLWGQEYGTAVAVGNLSSSSYAFAVYGNFNEDGSPLPGYKSLMYVRGDGNVGIGTGTPSEKLTVDGNIQLTGGKLQIANRATLQIPIAAENQYTRSMLGQNLNWDYTKSKWVLPDPVYPDFAMVRFENNGVLGFYTGTTSSTHSELTNVEMGSYGRMFIGNDGNVGIGTSPVGDHKLAVNGNALFTKVKVKAFSNWPDYVFAPGYTLMPLKEVESYVTQHRHLPGVIPAAEVEKNGLDLGDNQAILLQKIEELTLYIIQQQKQIEALEKRI